MTELELWTELKSRLIKTDIIEAAIYEEYFKPSSLKYLSNNKVALVMQTNFGVSVLKDISPKINVLINKIKGDECSLVLLTADKFEEEKKITKLSNKNSKLSKLTFDNFVSGKSNVNAYEAVKTLINNVGAKWNPLFIYGDSGLGKTHLLKAFEYELKIKKSNLKTKYYVSTDFRKIIIDSLQNNEYVGIEETKEFFLKYDVLLIDDVQFLANSDKTNEIFFNIFNKLIEQEKQIIITADKYPDQLNGFDKRLISRFNSGLSVRVETPDLETAYNIVSFKFKTFDVDASDELKNYIATYHANDVRKIEGIVNKIEFSIIQDLIKYERGKKLSLDSVFDLFKDYQFNVGGGVNINKIKEYIAKIFKTEINLLDGKNRQANNVHARHTAMYLAHKLLKSTYSEIGNSFGGKDHSTVMNAIRNVEKRITSEKQFKTLIKTAIKQLSEK